MPNPISHQSKSSLSPYNSSSLNSPKLVFSQLELNCESDQINSITCNYWVTGLRLPAAPQCPNYFAHQSLIVNVVKSEAEGESYRGNLVCMTWNPSASRACADGIFAKQSYNLVGFCHCQPTQTKLDTWQKGGWQTCTAITTPIPVLQ